MPAEFWTVEQAEPRPGIRRHWVLVPNTPVDDILDLPGHVLADLVRAINGLVRHEGGYSVGTRAGDRWLVGGRTGVVDVVVGDPDSTAVACYPMSAPAAAP